MVQIVLRREIKSMKIICEEWKIWGELKGTQSKGGQCPREKIKQMRAK